MGADRANAVAPLGHRLGLGDTRSPAIACARAGNPVATKPIPNSAEPSLSYPDDLIEHMSETGVGVGNAATGSEELDSILVALEHHLRRDRTESSSAQLHAELVAIEQAQRRIRATQARVMAAARASSTGREMGFINDRQMLTGGLGLSPGEARGRLDDAGIADTARMRASGEGKISAGHLRIIGKAMDELDDDDEVGRTQLELKLLALAEQSTTRQLQEHAHRLLDALDPGRTERGAEDRARRRSVSCGGQDLNLMARGNMTMDPQLAALMREVHARWGQPGRLWADPRTKARARTASGSTTPWCTHYSSDCPRTLRRRVRRPRSWCG